MELDMLLSTRRSVRSYQEGITVPKEAVEEMIRAALQAPTWKNSETGRYYVTLDPEKTAAVKAACLPSFNQNSAKNAPVLIVTSFQSGISGFNTDGTPTNELGDEWGAYDLGLQNENLLLKARELGYDTLVMGIRDEKALREMLGIPENEHVVSVISVGVRAKDPKAPARRAVEDVAVFF